MKLELNPLNWFGSERGETIPRSGETISSLSETQTAAVETQQPKIEPVAKAAVLEVPAKAEEKVSMAAAAVAVPVVSKVEHVAEEVFGILQNVAKDFEKGLTVVVKYLPEAAALAAIIYPPSVAITGPAISSADLLQKAIAAAEVQYQAMGKGTGSGAQKAADVLSVVESAVTSLLADPTVKQGLTQAGITVSTTYIQNLISCVVGILKIQAPTA